MADNLTIVPYRPGDEHAINELFRSIYLSSPGFEYWKWRYLENPFGPPLLELMWDGNLLVGLYALMPVRLWGGREIKAALSDLTITHLDYRYLGVFTSLGKSLCRRAAGQGIELIYGFPNRHNYKGYIEKLGWNALSPIKELTNWKVSLKSEQISLPQCKIEPLTKCENTLNHLWERIARSSNNKLLGIRDTPYLEWRYFKHPLKSYNILTSSLNGILQGYIAIQRNDTGHGSYLDIVDIAATETAIFCSLVNNVCAAKHDYDVEGVRIWDSVGTPFNYLLQSMGFRNSGISINFGFRDLADASLPPRDNLSSWVLSMGDRELYEIDVNYYKK